MKRLLEKIRQMLNKRRTRRILTRVVSIVGALVVFVTTYALVLPAITMEKQAACGIEEHQHDDSCFEEQLICGEEESETHQHTAQCYERVMVCGKPSHVHSTECYQALEESAETESGITESGMGDVTEADPAAATDSTAAETGTADAAADGIDDTGTMEASDTNAGAENGSDTADAEDIDSARGGSETTGESGKTEPGVEEDTGFDPVAVPDSTAAKTGTEDAAADETADTDTTNASDANADSKNETGKADAKDTDSVRGGSTGNKAADSAEKQKDDSLDSQAGAEAGKTSGAGAENSETAADAAEEKNETYAGLEGTLDLAEVLTDRTDFYYYSAQYDENGKADTESISSGSVTDWEKVKDNTEIAPEDFVRVYLAYTIPAGTLNKNHYTARYRLPGALRLTEDQIEAINKADNGVTRQMEDSRDDTDASTDTGLKDFPTDAETWRGAEAIEGTRTPDQKLDKGETEYISATVKVENIYKDGEYQGQDLILTFAPYTVSKNQTTLAADGKALAEGEKVKGFFALDLTPAQISCDETGSSEIRFAEESDADDTVSGLFAHEEILRTLHLKDRTGDAADGTDADPADKKENGTEGKDTDTNAENQTEDTADSKAETADAKNTDGSDADAADQADTSKDDKDKFLTGSVIAASGETYEIKVTYDDDAQIPDGSELRVKELLEEDDGYDDYCQQAVEKVEETSEASAGSVNGNDTSVAGDDASAAGNSASAPGDGSSVTGNGASTDGNTTSATDGAQGQTSVKKSTGYVRVFDIEIWNNDQKIEPSAEVLVEIRLLDAPENKETRLDVVHFAEDGPEVLPTDQNTQDTADTSLEFTTDAFSVYTIVGTETIETTYLTADGETYKITVNYTKDAEIPNGSELVVREILRGTQEYEEYRAQTQEALGTSDVPIAAIEGDEVPVAEDIAASDGEDAGPDPITYQVVGNAQSELTFIRLFDISIMNGEEEVEPKVPVEVVITYVEPMPTDGSSLDVVHFTDDGVEVLEEVTVSEDGTEIKYEAESFSVYGTARSAVGAGDYIIYRDGSNDYALNYNNGTLGRQSVSISGGQVYSAQDNVVWTFTSVSGGYRLSYQVGNTTYYLRNNNGTLTTTTNVNQASTWSYSNNRLSTGTGNQTRYLQYNNSNFSLSSQTNNATIYLAKIAEPATITIHYVNEAGEEIMASQTLPDSTSSGVTAIRDIVEVAAGYTYHNTYLTSTSGTQIVPELRGAGGGTWEYQVYGQETYTQFSGDTDIYVVYGNAYGGGSGSGSGGGGDDLEIDTPSAGKLVTPNTDGTFTLSLSITGEKDTGSDAHGANVILILDTSNSMDGSVSGGGTRFTNAVSAAQNVATNLMGLNTEDNPNLVEMCLVQFNKDVSTSGWYTTPGTANAQGTYPSGTFNRLIADASRNSGTNWEGALQAAITAANAHQDGDDTYIIFLTDGNPSTNATKTSRYDSEANTTTTSSHYYRISDNYMTATDEARQIVQNGWNFYSIGMYGNVDVLNYLTNFAYYGRSVNQTENKDTKGTYYYPAAETSTLIAALNDIADVISNSLAVAGVDFKDGIATDVTHTALSTNVGSGTLGGVTYRKNGGDSASYTVTTDSSGNATFNFSGTTVAGSVTTISYKKIVDVEGGDPVEQDATAQVYAATYNGTTYYMPIATVSAGGDFEWDVSPLGTLEDNATYTVSFKVWPDQDAYDYVTNLNNGISGYTWDYGSEEEVLTPSGSVAYYTDGVSQYPNIVRYPNGTFAAMSNTYQTVDYYVAQTEEKDGVTTTTYVKGDPIALDIPDPMVLTGSNFTVTKRWDDSLDQSQLAKLIADAAAQGETYSITLNLNEDGEFYKSYTFEPVWNESTEEYEWPSQTINIAPALLTSTNPGGTYKTVTIDGTTYYVLNEGHEYVLEETDLDSHFEFVTETYHPALVNGVLMNVAFEVNDNDEIVNGSTAEVVGTVPLSTFAGINTLKGGINIYKRVIDEEENIVDDDSTFKVQVALDHISESNLQIWFDTYEVDPATGEIVTPTEEQLTHWINTTTGEITETEPTGYKDKVQVIDAEKGIYKNANGVLYGVNGKTPVYADETNYIGTGGYGNVSGYTNILDIQDNWMIRIVNVLAGTTYEVVETQTNGMQPSYAYWHDNAESDEHIVIGNAASNIRITNKIVNRKVIVYKTDDGTTPTPLANAQFTINGETLTSGENGYTEVIELPTSDTPYDLIETEAPAGYNKLTEAVKVTVSSGGVTYQQGMGQPQTAEKDTDGNYVVHVKNNSGYELPHTGGSGTLPYTLGGLMLVIASALMYGFKMRRRERRLN